MKVFAAQLAFQFRLEKNGRSASRRQVELRVVHYPARNAESAYAKANRDGRDAEWTMLIDGCVERFEFLGLLELTQVGDEREDGEVWHEYLTLNRPMERRTRLLPKKSELHAFSGVERKDRRHLR